MNPKIKTINGPVVIADNARVLTVREMVSVGNLKLIGEVISLEGDKATIQVYEDTSGLKVNEEILPTSRPLSVRLGPGMLGNMFDGIQRPLKSIMDKNGAFIPSGIGFENLDTDKKWDVKITVRVGQKINRGEIYAIIKETETIEHRLMASVDGEVVEVSDDGKYTLEDTVVKIKTNKKNCRRKALSILAS